MTVICVDTSLYNNNIIFSPTPTTNEFYLRQNIVYVTYTSVVLEQSPVPVKSKNKKYTKTPFLDQRSYYERREKIKRTHAKKSRI